MKIKIHIPEKTILIPASDVEVDVTIDVPIPVPPIPPLPVPSSGFFQKDSGPWNKKLTSEALSSNSTGFVNELVANCRLAGPWIATTQYSAPVYTVDASTPKEKVFIPNGQGSINDVELQKGIGIPPNIKAAGGTDGHVCIYDKSTDKLYDFWQFRFQNNRWEASSAGILPNQSTSQGILPRYANGNWNSATATHLPLTGGLIMLSELKAGVIPHALCYSLVRPNSGFVWPALTSDGYYSGANAIKEGQRFRFPANISINASWTPLTKMLVIAVRDYGMVLRDTGGAISFYVEDPTPYGQNEHVLDPYMAGKNLWDIMGTKDAEKEFPFSKLQALA